jgi:hypothetical protein
MDKDYFVNKYKELRESNRGKKPLSRDFLNFCGVHRRKLNEVFGKNAYSKLQEECGDNPNKLSMERTPLKQIFEQYGQFIRKSKGIPVIPDWEQSKYRPTTDGLSKVHKLKWSEMPSAFMKAFVNKPEWKDAIEILKNNSSTSTSDQINKTFSEIVDKIIAWTPNRKRIIEEGYKIELRSYLEKYFNLEEEVGESNPDLLLNKKFPIEVKKDPTQSEYDRLLGQMIRHNKLYGSAIAIVTSISSEDRFKKFQKLFSEIHSKLGMKAELIKK